MLSPCSVTEAVHKKTWRGTAGALRLFWHYGGSLSRLQPGKSLMPVTLAQMIDEYKGPPQLLLCLLRRQEGSCTHEGPADLLRTMRQAPAGGPAAMQALIDAQAVVALVEAAYLVLGFNGVRQQEGSAGEGVMLGVSLHVITAGHVLLATIISQVLGNLAMSGMQGCGQVWRHAYPQPLQLLLQHPSSKCWLQSNLWVA